MIQRKNIELFLNSKTGGALPPYKQKIKIKKEWNNNDKH